MLLLYFHSGRPIVIEKIYIAKFKVGQQRPTFSFLHIVKVNYTALFIS